MPDPIQPIPVQPDLPSSNTAGQIGRPTKMTPDVVRKIEQVAALDGSVEEMAYYAGIHKDTIYAWLKNDKEFSDRIQQLRERPVLKARQTINAALTNPDHAFRYMERKKPKEFMPTAKIQHEGQVSVAIGAITPEQEALRVRFENELRATLAEPNTPTPVVETPPVAPSDENNQEGENSVAHATPGTDRGEVGTSGSAR